VISEPTVAPLVLPVYERILECGEFWVDGDLLHKNGASVI